MLFQLIKVIMDLMVLSVETLILLPSYLVIMNIEINKTLNASDGGGLNSNNLEISIDDKSLRTNTFQ